MDNFCGKRLDGRYEIREIIGVGGMAVVYKAYDNIDDRIVAIKILKDEYLTNEELKRRFKNESKAIAVLSHPNIVKVYDVSYGNMIQYIVMEYIDGKTLKQLVQKRGAFRNMQKNITSRNNYLQGSSPMKCWNGNFPTEQVWMGFPKEELVMRK